MYRSIASRSIISAFGLIAMFAAGTAAADEYRVTAFGNAKAYTALISQDASKAATEFGSIEVTSLDFAEANNLCITRILSKELPMAISACEAALEKLTNEVYISVFSEKLAKASIYSNLAVAEALSGNFSAANGYLEVSLGYNSDDANALANYDLIATSLIAQN